MRIPKIGEKIFLKNHDLYKKIQCTVSSVGISTVLVRPFRSRDMISVDEDDIIYIEPEALNGKEKRELLKKFIGDQRLDHSTYLAELGMLNKLLKRFPLCDFWRQFEPPLDANSMRLYLIQDNIEKMAFEYNSFNLAFQPKVNSIVGKKLGEDIVVEKFKLE